MIVGAAIPQVVTTKSETRELELSEREFTSLYDDYAHGLRAYVTRRVGNRSTAEDIVQRAFVRLLGARLTTLERPALKAYLYRIATNLVNDHWRRTRPELGGDSLPESRVSFGSAALRNDFDRVLGRIGERDRALVWLAHVEEMSHREIAEVLGLEEKSIKVLLFRARKKLAEILRKEGYSGGER